MSVLGFCSISALDRPVQQETQLSTLCKQQLQRGGLLAGILHGQREAVKIQKDRSLHNKDIKAIEAHASQMKQIWQALRGLESEMSGGKPETTQ